MKIWFPAIRTGTGTDVFTTELAAGLRRRGIDTEITWFHHAFELAPFLLRGTTAPAGTDIVHANSWNGFAFARGHIPLVVTEHHVVLNPEFRRYQTWAQHLYHATAIRLYERLSFSSARVVTAVSGNTAADLKRVYRLDAVEVIPNWVNTEEFRPLSASPRTDKDRFVLLFVGKPSTRKGVDLLQPIMERLGPGFELWVVGHGAESYFRGAPENIHALGSQSAEELRARYRQCDALLSPSRLEGFGLAVLEAMACGKPVVTSNISALPEIVAHDVSGLLCPVDDIEAFVEACRRLQEEPATTVRLGEAARRRAVELFSEDNAMNRYIALYKRILEA